MIFSGFLACFWEILSIIGGSGAFFEADLGRKLGGCFQLQNYKNQRFLEALDRFREG
jgi:hypothetical protein